MRMSRVLLLSLVVALVNGDQMEDGGKFDYKIEFVGLFVLDEDFLLGEEKTITLPHTGEEVK